MPHARFARSVAAALFVVTIAASCARDDYDSAGARSELVRAGLTQEQARCAVDAMEDTIGELRVGERDEPTQKERAKFAAVLELCGVNDASTTTTSLSI